MNMGGKAREGLCPACTAGPQGVPDTSEGACRMVDRAEVQDRTSALPAQPAVLRRGADRVPLGRSPAPPGGDLEEGRGEAHRPSLPCEQSCSRQTCGSHGCLGNMSCKAGVKDTPERTEQHVPTVTAATVSGDQCRSDTHTEDRAARDCSGDNVGASRIPHTETREGILEGEASGLKIRTPELEPVCGVRAERPLQGMASWSQKEGQGLHRPAGLTAGCEDHPPTWGQGQGLATVVQGEAAQLAAPCTGS